MKPAVVVAMKVDPPSFCTAILFGALTVAMSFGADHVGNSHLFEIISTAWSTMVSPLMGVFLLSFFAKWSNGPVNVQTFI